MAKERIEHEGRVIAVDKDYISVEIVNKSACAACHARRMSRRWPKTTRWAKRSMW